VFCQFCQLGATNHYTGESQGLRERGPRQRSSLQPPAVHTSNQYIIKIYLFIFIKKKKNLENIKIL
jgi:hypothetical protein